MSYKLYLFNIVIYFNNTFKSQRLEDKSTIYINISMNTYNKLLTKNKN